MFLIDAAAYTGTDNDHIDYAREYVPRDAGDANMDLLLFVTSASVHTCIKAKHATPYPNKTL